MVTRVARYANITARSLVARRILKPRNLMNELASSGVNHNINDVVMVVRRPGGIDTMPANNRLIWLENGNSNVGLNHILERHSNDFGSCTKQSECVIII